VQGPPCDKRRVFSAARGVAFYIYIYIYICVCVCVCVCVYLCIYVYVYVYINKAQTLVQGPPADRSRVFSAARGVAFFFFFLTLKPRVG